MHFVTFLPSRDMQTDSFFGSVADIGIERCQKNFLDLYFFYESIFLSHGNKKNLLNSNATSKAVGLQYRCQERLYPFMPNGLFYPNSLDRSIIYIGCLAIYYDRAL